MTIMRDLINPLEKQFEKMADSHKAVRFANQCQNALNILENNNYLQGIARNNPGSLQLAILSSAEVGISLDPVKAYAYLVPRYVNKQQSICLDISYKGIAYLAMESGAIEAMWTEIVYENDVFEIEDIAKKPIHKFSPLKPRGEMALVYNTVRTSAGDHITEMMTIKDLHKIRNSSEAFKAYSSGKAKQCPWVDYFEEMSKKAVIKRASKRWPTHKTDNRLNLAIEAVNSHEGTNFKEDEEPKQIAPREENSKELQALAEEKEILLGEIKSSLARISKDMDAEGKYKLLKEKCGVSSFQDLKRKGLNKLYAIMEALEEGAES